MPDDLEKKAREYLIARYGHGGFGTGDMAAFARQVRSETVEECVKFLEELDEERYRYAANCIRKKFGSE